MYSRIRIFLMTLAIGLASINFVETLRNYWMIQLIELPRTESVEPIIVYPGTPQPGVSHFGLRSNDGNPRPDSKK